MSVPTKRYSINSLLLIAFCTDVKYDWFGHYCFDRFSQNKADPLCVYLFESVAFRLHYGTKRRPTCQGFSDGPKAIQYTLGSLSSKEANVNEDGC